MGSEPTDGTDDGLDEVQGPQMQAEDELASGNPCLVMVGGETDERYAQAVGQKGVGKDLSTPTTHSICQGKESGHICEGSSKGSAQV